MGETGVSVRGGLFIPSADWHGSRKIYKLECTNISLTAANRWNRSIRSRVSLRSFFSTFVRSFQFSFSPSLLFFFLAGEQFYAPPAVFAHVDNTYSAVSCSEVDGRGNVSAGNLGKAKGGFASLGQTFSKKYTYVCIYIYVYINTYNVLR